MILAAFHPGLLLSILAFGLLFAFVFWRWSRNSEDPPGILLIKLIVSAVLLGASVWCIVRLHPIVGVPIGAACGIIIGILWGTNIGAALASPLSSLYDGGNEAPEQAPFYAIALAHRKQARYTEAIAAIQGQLERFPGDVQGLLLLGEIHARNLGDWSAALDAIQQIVEQSEVPVPTRSKALQALADWHLDLGGDASMAREQLQRIQDLFPGTPEANEAAQRLAHLGEAGWRETRGEPAKLRVIEGDPHLGLKGRSLPEPPPERDAALIAEELQRQLSAHPLDTEARENLAILYADRLGHLDWAVAEMERLIAQPHHPPRSVARWLNMLADLHIRCAADEAAARSALERIEAAMPNSALAAKARSRLDHLKLELRASRVTPRLKSPGTPGPG